MCTSQCRIAQYLCSEVYLFDYSAWCFWKRLRVLHVIVSMSFTCNVSAVKVDGYVYMYV